jgi:hypothetical protein
VSNKFASIALLRGALKNTSYEVINRDSLERMKRHVETGNLGSKLSDDESSSNLTNNFLQASKFLSISF